MTDDHRRIRVLQVIGTMHIGGAENVIVELARQLDRSRFDVGVCCTRELGVLAEQLMAESVDVILAAPGDRRLRYLTPFFLRSAAKRFGADVIHTHGTPGLLHAGTLAAFGLMPTWVHTFHYGNYRVARGRQMTAERLLCRAASQLVTVSESQRQAIAERHRLSSSRMITIVNGVTENPAFHDTAAAAKRRTELGFGPHDVVVGCIAVLSVQKGLTYLLRAARDFLARDPRLQLLVVGGGPTEQPLRKEAEELGLGSRVVFTGWRPDAAQLLPVIDIFVMSSLWEAMPMALLEAMAAKRAIVVTDVGDNVSIVDYGNCGVIVPPAAPEPIAAAVLQLATDSEHAAEMAERAQCRFRDHFTTARMVAEYEALYLKLVVGETRSRHRARIAVAG